MIWRRLSALFAPRNSSRSEYRLFAAYNRFRNGEALVGDVVHGERSDDRSSVGHVLDEPLVHELSDRFADRTAAYAELLGELRLDQAVARQDGTA